ncbi:MAG: hypothetical protein B6D61_03815 [Bacteroidetes bacterium 4484_249]|nr:MAG: hypothetical protein B6D61_03815 [Bacteroidetes bacterium 4484_249]
MKQLFGIIISVVIFGQTFSQTKEVPFTLDDRDRIIKIEERLNSTNLTIASLESELNGKITSLRNEMNSKFDSIERSIDVLYWGFAIVISLILFLFGYIVFDRKTGLKPLEQDMSIIKHRQNNLSKAIKELAQVDNKFAEAIKKVAL